MSRKVAIVQSNYIPWKGYFDLIASVDEFVLYDDVQYTRRDWRNRNKIKTPQGVQWLTIPVRVKGKYHQLIRETEVEGHDWAQTHWKTLLSCYGRAAHFATLAPQVEALYGNAVQTHLSQVNRAFIEWACARLGIGTRISDSASFALAEERNARLLGICVQAGATEYVSGPSARGYLDEAAFAAKGISVNWFDYDGYPEYPQLWGGFEHGVSVLDLLFNCGPDAPRFMKHVRP